MTFVCWRDVRTSRRRTSRPHQRAIKEYGALRRTVYARYLVDETDRRRTARQLNKGENLHALRRCLAYASEEAIRRRRHEQQTEQMWCLTLATNAIVCRSTEPTLSTSTGNSPNSTPTATARCVYPTPRAAATDRRPTAAA
jgi:hypothetical protein